MANKPTIGVKQYLESYSYMFKGADGNPLLELSSTGDIFIEGVKADDNNPIVQAFKKWCKEKV